LQMWPATPGSKSPHRVRIPKYKPERYEPHSILLRYAASNSGRAVSSGARSGFNSGGSRGTDARHASNAAINATGTETSIIRDDAIGVRSVGQRTATSDRVRVDAGHKRL
jgi:hypothetical protein